jgi:hypothetical protein
VKINQFKGWVPAFSRYLLPPGGAVEQVNMTCLTPGQLTVRGGSKKIANTPDRLIEMWGYSVGSGQTDKILGQDDDGNIVEVSGIGGTATNSIIYKGQFSGQHPVSFAQGRRGEVYVYQGYGKRGLVRTSDGKVRPVGLDAPKTKPTIVIDSTQSYYIARIDIIDSGNGYNIPPSVYIGEPGVGGRQAKAISRIADAQVSEIEVTDGGSGYTKAPCVKLTDTPNGPATGTGAAAAIELETGAAKGDPETGIVYWEISQLPTWFWLCLNEYAREGKGIIVPAVGGSGTGAKAIFWIDGLYDGNCYKQNSDGTDLDGFGVRVQVYDFGQGYKPDDVVKATIKTASAFQAGAGFNGPRCDLPPQQCQVVAEGITLYNAKAPDKLTIIDASPYKQRKIKTTVTKGGSGYLTPPIFQTEDGDIINTEVDCEGRVTKLKLAQPNKLYLFPPKLIDTSGDVGGATALAIVRPNFRGKYQCFYRFVDESLTKEQGGPLYSDLSPVNEVDCGDCAKQIAWSNIPSAAQATHVELWRSTSNQAITLFRVAKLPIGSDSFTDTLSDYDLTNADRADFEGMPILLSDGRLNANRFGVAPTDMAVGVVFQDRTFVGVDTTGKRPNTLMYSEADQPEAIPEVNELVLQTNLRDTDYITALIPYAGALMVMQSRHCHRLNFVKRPELDATSSLVAYRGCLNQRCWDIWLGTAYVLDDCGIYTLDPQGQVEDLSAAISTLFRSNTDPGQPTIDFAKREWFFLRADKDQGVIRIHVSFTGDEGTFPTRQIVYDPDSKSFWLEQYPYTFSSATQVRTSDGSLQTVTASEEYLHVFSTGLTDDGIPIDYSFRTGNLSYETDETSKTGAQQGSRNISVVYRPTGSTSVLKLANFYNGSNVPRANVAMRDRGVGFVHQTDEPASTVDMVKLPHQEAESHGVARALFSGKTITDFYGSDSHVSARLYGQQTDAGPVVLHSIDIAGVVAAGGD